MLAFFRTEQPCPEPWEAKELIKRHIYALRQKIEPHPDQPQFILNVRGVGYRLPA